MPIECTLLRFAPVPLERCPKCGARPFEPFIRGYVQRFRWWGLRPAYCCLICTECKEIVGHEAPPPHNDGLG